MIDRLSRIPVALIFLGFVILCYSQCKVEPAQEKAVDTGTTSSTTTAAVPHMTAGDSIIKDALPFTLSFKERSGALPAVQSYSHAITAQHDLLVVGGRKQGLHTFLSSGDNFPSDSSNNLMHVINLSSGDVSTFDVNQLDSTLAMPLQSTNQQGCYVQSTGMYYLVGGYGWNASSRMLTFGTIIRFNLQEMINASKSGASPGEIGSLMEIAFDDRFAVTGGDLFYMNGRFFLVFGQKFMGQYNAFGGENKFTQEYTNEIRMFTLDPNELKILSYGAITNSESDEPFHRRDGNIVDDIDPATGQPRISAYGGVFTPGVIGAYTYPIYIDPSGQATLDRTITQKFSQYECPIITVYDDTPGDQREAYAEVTAQGRNDGLPYVADITSLSLDAQGNHAQYIHLNPIPGNRLLGTSIKFIPNPTLKAEGIMYDNGVVRLSTIPVGSTVTIGYIYGGIEANQPLPLTPNAGTHATNTFFEVQLINYSSDAIPASASSKAEKNHTYR